MTKKLNGCRTLHEMVRNGQIEKAWLWIDDYNKVTNDIAGTIVVGISYQNHYHVSVYEEQ